MAAKTIQQWLDERGQDPETLAELTGEGNKMRLFIERLTDGRGISRDTIHNNRKLNLKDEAEIRDPLEYLGILADTLGIEVTDIEFLNPDGNFTLTEEDVARIKG